MDTGSELGKMEVSTMSPGNRILAGLKGFDEEEYNTENIY
jgi:hypothetical protein